MRKLGLLGDEAKAASQADSDYRWVMENTSKDERDVVMDETLAALVDEGLMEYDGEGYTLVDEIPADALSASMAQLGVAIGDSLFLADGPVDVDGRYRGIGGVPNGEVRICQPRELGLIITVAAQRNYNRQLDPELVQKIDPTGVNVLTAFMLHGFAQGERSDVHVRARAMLKLSGREEALERFLDVPYGLWVTLERAPQRV